MSSRLPYSAQSAKALPVSQIGIGDPIIIGPPIGAPLRPGSDFSRDLAKTTPLGMLLSADLDIVDVLLRLGAAIVGVAFIIAGGFLIVKEYQTSSIGKAIGQGAGAIKSG